MTTMTCITRQITRTQSLVLDVLLLLGAIVVIVMIFTSGSARGASDDAAVPASDIAHLSQ